MKLIKIISAIALWLVPCITNAQTLIGPHIYHQKLDDHILLVKTGEVYPDQIVAISTEKGIIIIDSGVSPTLSTEYRSIIEKEFDRDDFLYVINTHHHFDHTNGNQVFNDAVIIAHDSCPGEMENFASTIDDFIAYRKERYLRRDSLAKTLDTTSMMFMRLSDMVFTSRMMCNDLENNFRLTLPELTFASRLEIDLGNITLILIYFGPDLHTNNDILVYIPERGIVFTGDLLQEYENYSMIRSHHDIAAWIKALDEVIKTEYPIKSVITIHAGILPPERFYSFRNTLANMLAELEKKSSAISHLEHVIKEMDVHTGIAEFNKWWGANDENYYLWEGDLKAFANDYLENKEYENALSLFKLNVELFPESMDAIDWLGIAYMDAGQKKEALKCFNQSLELNPLNSWAKDMIFSISR